MTGCRPSTISWPAMLRLCLGGALCVLTGCLVGPKYQVPVATVEALPAGYKESPSQYKGSDGWKVARPKDAMLRGAWWRVFKDPELNALEADLNINDQNIKQYFENYMIARALVGEQRAQLYPTVTATGSYTAARTPPLASQFTTAQSLLNFNWEPDLWGRIRNLVRGAQYNAQVSAADLENERLSEQTSLAVYYFELRGQDALEVLYRDTIVAYQKALDFTQAQFETGITDKIAVVEATNTLQNAEATLTNLGVARAQYEHAIAVLTGRVASKFSIPAMPLKATPPPLPVGLALADAGAAAGHRRRGTLDGGGQRGDRHGLRGLLSHAHARCPGRQPGFVVHQPVQRGQPPVVARAVRLRNDLRCGPAPRDDQPVRRHV